MIKIDAKVAGKWGGELRYWEENFSEAIC